MRRAGRRPVAAVAVVAALGVLLSGCTGVPTSSAPQVVATIGDTQQEVEALPSPPPAEPPRQIVIDFLDANASNDGHHAAARQYLTSEEKTRWSDTAGTTILDAVKVGTEFDTTTDSITVTGHVVGTLDQNGVYKPNLQSVGSSTHNAVQKYVIGLRHTARGWRIGNLSYSGLLISQSQFARFYRPWRIYFYDQAEQRLVPSLRYSPLTDPKLVDWLLGQLAAGPAPASPTTAALTTDLPSIPDTAQLKIKVGAQISVDLPGASQLDSAIKNRMATQIALTVNQAAVNRPIEITDGAKPVVIPSVGSATFTATDFGPSIPAAIADPALYYVSQGGVSDARGHHLAGELGDGGYDLAAVALARITGSSRLRVAGVAGSGEHAQLLIGETGSQMRATAVSGRLSRPDWVPGMDEVWIGDGSTLYRVGPKGKAAKVPVTLGSGANSGRIVAVRLSPEGARVALVVEGGNRTAQIWVGTIARSANSVQVTGAAAISPADVVITDVAWADEQTLDAVGHTRELDDAGVYSVRCDGSFWSASGIGDLPQPPDSISVAQGVFPPTMAVSAGSTVWVQSNGDWVSPGTGVYTYGTNPIYVN